MSIGIVGAGAFGTALGITLCGDQPVTLWSRHPGHAHDMRQTHENTARLPGLTLPDPLQITADLSDLSPCDTVLLCVPMQKLRDFLKVHQTALFGKTLVACCKGMELGTGAGPLDIIAEICPEAPAALLTGPSFAQDIARGLPTALTLAAADPALGATLQDKLSNRTLRLYRTTDVTGASLGGALKNVIAIACGAAMGAGLGESARAALMTRGNAEMQRLAAHKGADPATLSGLSGFGDLVLTCTSPLSRNYSYGLALGSEVAFDSTKTVEGAATAQAVTAYATEQGLDLPISSAVAGLVEKRLDVAKAMQSLLARSLKEE